MLKKIVVNVFLLSSLKSRILNHTEMLSISIRLLVRQFTSPTLRTNSNKNNFGLLQKNTITTTGQCGTDMGHSHQLALWFSLKSVVFLFHTTKQILWVTYMAEGFDEAYSGLSGSKSSPIWQLEPRVEQERVFIEQFESIRMA